VSAHHTWGEYRVFYDDGTGVLGAMPVNWTDVGEIDAYVAVARGRAFCRPSDLLRLCDLSAKVHR